jgi:hypothetical protein
MWETLLAVEAGKFVLDKVLDKVLDLGKSALEDYVKNWNRSNSNHGKRNSME